MPLQFSRHAVAAVTVIVITALGADALAQPTENRGVRRRQFGANLEQAEDGVVGESAGSASRPACR